MLEPHVAFVSSLCAGHEQEHGRALSLLDIATVVHGAGDQWEAITLGQILEAHAEANTMTTASALRDAIAAMLRGEAQPVRARGRRPRGVVER